MSDIVIGILAIAVGAVFCFSGTAAMRFVIALWGAFAGLNLGAGLVSAITGDGYFATALGWIVGILVALLFAVLAYLYYAVAVTLAMASVGFALGTAAMVAVGVTWNWVVVLVGVILGVALAVLTLAVDLPAVLLVVVSVLGGAVAMVGGVMLLAGAVDTADFDHASLTTTISDDWWWYAMYVALVVAGVVAQSRMLGRERSLRDQWRHTSAPSVPSNT
ncbi:DUF4203 domain-containing protein [Rhodococcus sp. TAF43]|uniref:DUF4203 domain-containing protein n=1 Tax=unclassified Rhodococcus (in: high G+C Gram-positive bacteria) TaxID=192944 RepID=UPI000E0AB796|nr:MULTISPECIES: DUF4203 domain-containing protein [unclassified Rhodococcus (in: high G+C Gram-positive bacteria)]QKT11265.1 DUF4203 domain-containing protein [Rhodococcus sp. W8901]RDI31545.1 hypothetical protein DEU38_104259 [Rhodococcus sp. AG1013]